MTATVSPPVMASTPFLTVSQAAAELGTTPLNLKRLIARGVLKAVSAGETAKLTPAALSAYAAAGAPDFAAPNFDAHETCIWEPEIVGRHDRFRDDVRQVIADSVLPDVPRDARGQIVTRVAVPLAGKLAEIVRRPPYRPQVTFAGHAHTTPYATAVEEYCAVELRSAVQGEVQRAASRIGTAEPVDISGVTDLHRLYESPEAYRRYVAAAVQTYLGNSLGLVHHYPSPGQPGRTVSVSYVLPHDRLGVDTTKVIRLAF